MHEAASRLSCGRLGGRPRYGWNMGGPEPQRVTPLPETGGRYSRLARKDTTPEVALRRELHRRGLRFRVEYKVEELPRRRMDIAFPRLQLAVLVDGCFWHGCPLHYRPPTSNAEWWNWKIARVGERDRDTNERLNRAGWTVIRAWEHESVSEVADRVESLVRGERSGGH